MANLLEQYSALSSSLEHADSERQAPEIKKRMALIWRSMTQYERDLLLTLSVELPPLDSETKISPTGE